MRFPKRSQGSLSGRAEERHKFMSSSTKEKVIDILRRVLGPEADLNATRLELESLKMLEVVVTLENEFGISIPEDAPLGRITSSVKNIVTYLDKLQPR